MDVVIPYHEKDEYTVYACIDSCKKHIKNLENIYVISKNRFTYDNVKWIPEEAYPFSISDIGRVNSNIHESRRAWYYQQLLKLYVFKVYSYLNEFLIVDSDVIFLKDYYPKVEGKWAYNTLSFIHEPYALNAELIHPSLTPFDKTISGVTHTMLFERKRLQELFNRIKRQGEEVWETIISSLKYDVQGEYGGEGSALSEYDLYFNFIMNEYPEQYVHRKINYADVKDYKDYLDNKEFTYVANHAWMRTTPLVVNELKGKLANQMFQIATGYALAKDTGANFAINYDDYARWHVGSPENYREFYSNIPETGINPQEYYEEKSYSYNPITTGSKDTKLKGYFQSPLYFDRYKENIKNLFNFPEIDLTDIINKDTIGIHIRRGDYANFPEHDILDEDYYYRAIESIGIGNIIICTDEPEWVRERFDYPISPMKSDIEDLYLLSQCNRLILSNSSFSWWGAYLGVKKDKVIVPNIWFGEPGPHDYHDIYLQEWEKMPI